MKTKKVTKADVDHLRPLFFKIGLGLSLLMVIISFNWTIYDSQSLIILPSDKDYSETEEWAEIVKPEQEKKKPEHIEIEIVDIEVETDQNLLDQFNQDKKENDSVPLVNIEFEKEIVLNEVIDFHKVEKKPSFPGGEAALIRFINSTISYPELELSLAISGLVVVEFTINADGSISDAVLLKEATKNLNNEALRVINKMPRWNPGYQRDKAVPVKHVIPVRFTVIQ